MAVCVGGGEGVIKDFHERNLTVEGCSDGARRSHCKYYD